MKINKQILITAIASSCTSAVVFTLIGLAIGYGVFSPNKEENKLIEEYKLLKEDWLYGDENTNYTDLASEGLVSKISSKENDKYTFYTSTYQGQGLSTSGFGFGVNFRPYDGNILIYNLENGTAKKAGVNVGTVFCALQIDNGEKYIFKDHSFNEISTYISNGNVNSNYVFFKEDNSTISLKKEKYAVNSTCILEKPTDENNNLMIVKINDFLGEISKDVKQYLLSFSNTKNIIFDLRGNGGGYVSEAENLSKLFVNPNTLIDRLVDKNNKTSHDCYQKNKPEFTFNKIAVILDSNSASATETFALTMRTLPNCTLYGFNSYGKGIAQSFKQFSDGSVVRYTSNYVYGPKRNNDEKIYKLSTNDSICIHNQGITPDVKYTSDYQFLYGVYDYTQSISVSEAGQYHLLNSLNYLHDVDSSKYTILTKENEYPLEYNSSYHFNDLLKDCLNVLFFNSSIIVPSTEKEINDFTFDTNGRVSKLVSDRINKVTFDCYLKEYDNLTDMVKGNYV